MNTRLLALMVLIGLSTSLFSQDFYDVNSIESIEITFEESNWDAILDTYYSNDNDEKLMGSVVINGVEYDSIGVKYKGNSTYSAGNAKNPLHIYLDYLIDDQNYEGYESIKLSNGKNDPSFVREVLSYEIARKYMAAPLSNYAKVYINGSYYGMFSNSEAINGDFTDRRLYADKDNTRVKCNPENTNDGNGSSLEYLGTDSADYYNYYEVKSDYGWQDLIDFTYEIAYDPNDIERILDIDRAIWMLAFNNVLVNLDSYTGPFRQNYYLIKDDNGKFLPVIWDLNESLGAFETIDMGGVGSPGGGPPGSSTDNSDLTDLDPFLREDDTTYPLIKMIFDNERYTKMYIAHCKTMLEENFVSGWYLTQANSLQGLISDDLADDPNAFYSSTQFTGNLSSTQDNTIGISELMTDRITFLQSETAFQYTQPTITNIIAPDTISPYTTVTVTAEVSDANYVHLGYRYSKDDSFVKIEMFDDGAHNDGAAGDNIYGISFIVDESNTHYYIYAENDDAGMFSPEAAEHEYYKLSAVAVEEENTDVVLNELLAKNTTIQADQDGEFDDWVELYNNTDEDISLLGYYLTDDDEDIMQWAFPDTVIAANSYLIIWADKDDEQDGLHASFKLSATGESVYLVNSDNVIVNSTTFGEQTEDMAHARVPNGIGAFFVQSPTFSAMNTETFSLNNISLTVDGGSTTSITTLSLSTFSPTTENDYIIYTITATTLNGQIEHTDNAGVAISSFSQQDLAEGEIQYVHDGTNTISDSFTFDVTDDTDQFTEQIFTINISHGTSIESNSITAEQILVYPNPSSSYLFIETTTGILEGSIYAIDGSKKTVELVDYGNGTYYMDINHLSGGVYVLKLQTKTGFETKIILVN